MTLAALIFLLAPAPAAADSCSQESNLLWVVPSSGEYEIPANVIFRAQLGEGDSPADDWGLSVVQTDGTPVPYDVEVVEVPGDLPYDQRFLHTLSPRQPLEVGSRYAFTVSPNHDTQGESRTVAAIAGPVDTTPPQGQPSLTVLSAYDTEGAGEEACDWETVRVFELVVTPAEGDPAGQSILHVYRLRDADATPNYVRPVRVSESGGAETLSLRFDNQLSWGDCFVAVQEDGAGNLSAESEIACAPEPLQPSPDGDDTGAGAAGDAESGSACRGCDAGAGLVGMLGLMLSGLVAGSRRR